MNNRIMRGYAILAKGDEPKKIGVDSYLIPSQNSNKKYLVKKVYDKWTCECPDFKGRKIECKHINATKFWLNLKSKIESKDCFDVVRELDKSDKCIYCGSENIVKNGNRKKKQRFLCKSCKRTFVSDPFKKFKGDGKMITLVMDLYFKGISLRKIQDHLKQFYNIKLHHETIRRWVVRFTDIMNSYVNTLNPKLSDAWHADEQMIKSKGKNIWSWNILDEHTRFLIANKITEKREIADARAVFSKAKKISSTNPEFIITDGLWSYEKAIKKEFSTWRLPRTNHIRLRTIKDKPNNNLVERYHSSFRERDKVMHGFKGTENAQALTDGYRLFYNFIRIHQGLDMTPAQKANLDLSLGQNRWLSLLRQSL